MQFLVLASPAEGGGMEQVRPHIKEEAARLWQLYGAGQIRAIYSRGDRPGMVALLEAEDAGAAQAAMNALPMAQAGLLRVEVVPLEPYTVFEQAFGGERLAT